MSTDGSDGGSSIIQACRACLDTKIMNYVQFDNKDGGWNELYQFCFGFSVKSEIGSQLLCSKCADLVKCYAEFKKQCQKSEEFWCSILLNDAKYSVNVTDIKVEGFEPFTAENDAMADLHYTKDNNNIHDQNEEIDKLKDENDLSDRDDGLLNQHNFYENKSYINSHTKIRKKGITSGHTKKWSCSKCQKKYKNSKWLKLHSKTCLGRIKKQASIKNKSEVMYCGLCDFSSEQDSMKQHLDIHALSNDLSCRSCDFVGKDFASMVSHRYSHQPKDIKPKIFCHLCDKTTRSCSFIEYHYRTVHLNKPGLNCSMCNKSFKSYKTWRNHNRWHKVDRYICDICGKKFLFRHGIKEHLMNHADFDKYICEICGRGFKRLFNLKSHVSNRHKTYESVKCSHCNKTFKSEFNLQKHLKYEAKEKLFNCPVCPKKFPTEVTMKNHLFWHSDERPFSCEICGNKYKAKSQLKIHMRQHTGIMPFKCQLCEKSFASSNQLKVHRSVHTGIRRYKCDYCIRTFHTRKLLETHCAAQHKDKKIELCI
ncbi:uncharacterized protein [Choristoneura fumiferana]|uniref:uncharacterized protein n=1 Tax=Choristoneura fumiferana TaxID=7141 RepID=UPI003D15CC76